MKQKDTEIAEINARYNALTDHLDLAVSFNELVSVFGSPEKLQETLTILTKVNPKTIRFLSDVKV